MASDAPAKKLPPTPIERALDSETFLQGCPKGELSLTPVRCNTWGGFVWIHLDPDATSLREYLEVIPAHLDRYVPAEAADDA